MKTCVLLLAVVAACVAMPHPGPPAPPMPMGHMPPMAGLAGMAPPGADETPMKKAGPTDMKTEETMYLANPYGYSAYSSYGIRGPGLTPLAYQGYQAYPSYGLQYGYPGQQSIYPYYYA